MAVKVLVIAALLVAFLWLVYIGSKWYFEQKRRESELAAEEAAREQARLDAIWADDDPETFDEETYRERMDERQR